MLDLVGELFQLVKLADRYIEESTMRSIIYLMHIELSKLLSVLTESQSNNDNSKKTNVNQSIVHQVMQKKSHITMYLVKQIKFSLLSSLEIKR